MSSTLERVLVLIPTYNEKDSLPGVVTRVRAAQPQVDVLVLDDNSPDGTGDVADALSAEDEQVHVLHRPGKQGLGPAYLAGFAWATEHGYDAVVEMDADGSHLPEQLDSLLLAARDADLVIGSRWVPGGATHNWPWTRNLLSRGANIYTRTALGIPVRDATAGYRVYRTSALRTMDLDGVASQGYCFQVDLTLRAVDRGLRVVEVPIDFVEREVGTSKMDGSIVREALASVTLWGLRRRGLQAGSAVGRLGRRVGSGGTWHQLTD
ncbi:polyprenol monophosphomannose synthase [Ornithinimicrobium cavernae]|uniref:polyprenol monophosphomannose synthase n=1 Tax=Ornithinimicrobium cavernae TaxID=2666047 RepID=UPI000D68E9EB|nr:polyprenol monophosphomannose synthase [Ornithinimicrobium cavernae]